MIQPSFDEGDVGALTCLGLTDRQARVYLALVFAGPATVKNISRISTVARQDTYQILTKLYKKGLVEKIIATPATFKATPLKKALDVLFQSKATEIDSAHARTSELLSKFAHKNEMLPKQHDHDKPQFTLISSREKLDIAAAESTKAADKSIDMSGTWEAFRAYIFATTESLQRAKEKKVKCRVIINKVEDKKALSEIGEFLRKNPNFKLKCTTTKAPFHILILDQKIASLSLTHEKFDHSNITMLESRDNTFVELIQDYFNKSWNESTYEML
jgi:sugar-specific transcriptional regulator TrmB